MKKYLLIRVKKMKTGLIYYNLFKTIFCLIISQKNSQLLQKFFNNKYKTVFFVKIEKFNIIFI